jgi:hypothetical protein
MPSYDLSRERFRLAHLHLGVLGHLNDGEAVPEELAEAGAELVEVGLISDEGEVSPVLAELVGALAEPVITIVVEVTGAQGTMTHGVTLGNGAAFSHEQWPGDPESGYVRIEPTLLIFELARIVNLRKRDLVEPPVTTIESTMGALDAAFTALERTPPERQDADSVRRTARAALTAADGQLPENELSAFTDLIIGLRTNWRMTVAWSGENDAAGPGVRVAGFGIWDCGQLGYWHRQLPAEPILEGQVDTGSRIRLVHTPPKRLWKMIADSLPDKDEIRPRDA